MTDYAKFLQSKTRKATSVGIDINKSDINPLLFEYQKDGVKWAVKKGRCAIFFDTGLGKTYASLEWGRLLNVRTLIIAPLSVARQTVRMAKNIGIEVQYVRSSAEVLEHPDNFIFITNYEIIEHFDMNLFDAVVLDESSILKAISSSTRNKLTKMCQNVKYKLCCTATPAPNDNVEIGNHAEFLGICTQNEMLSEFFVNANKEHTFIDAEGKSYHVKGSNNGGQEWRLKHHAEQRFYEWLASWSIAMTKPSDLGYSDDGFILPELNICPHFVDAEYTPEGMLTFTGLKGVGDRAKVRRQTIDDRLTILDKLVNGNEDQWIVWCGLDKESTMAKKIIPDSVEVSGKHDADIKAQAFEDFQDGKIRVLITKGKIAGFGMNFQNAHNMVFFGLNDSWEIWYQIIRRMWRFGQKYPVNVHVILSNVESSIYENIKRKDAMAKRLRSGLIEQIKKYEEGELRMQEVVTFEYNTKDVKGKRFWAMLGDSCERLKEIEDNSVHLSVYSPPFEDLFTYSDSPRDLGNSRGSAEFFTHYKYIIRELLRVTKPGRLTCVHTSDIPAMLVRDGYIGMKDFPGDVIRAYEEEGWIYQGWAVVTKNPQAQSIRVHAKGLAFGQLEKDSSWLRPALMDRIIIMRKDGENDTPITPKENGEMNNETWIDWAGGVWNDISESDTLQFNSARDSNDEKHICPLQLGTIERCIKLYSNPGETVLTPFMGIGSEAYQAIRFNRRAIGIELKPSYFDVAVKNLQRAEYEFFTPTLFDL